MSFEFTFEGNGIVAEDGETVLSALLRHGHAIEHGCKAGACQSCLLRAVGESVPKTAQRALDESLADQGYFLSCQAAATSVAEVFRPDAQLLPRRPAVLTRMRMASHDVLIVEITVEGFAARRGQFLRLFHPSGAVRSYSIADSRVTDTATLVELHVRLIPNGLMSSLLATSCEDDPFEVEGPLGRGFYRPANLNKPHLLIGSGTGLAPLYGVALDAVMHDHSSPICLYHGGATEAHLYFRDEITALRERAPQLTYQTCADEAAGGQVVEGSPVEAALRDHPDLTGFAVYLCGHPGMVRAGQKKCFLAGADLQDIFADPFEDQSGQVA